MMRREGGAIRYAGEGRRGGESGGLEVTMVNAEATEVVALVEEEEEDEEEEEAEEEEEEEDDDEEEEEDDDEEEDEGIIFTNQMRDCEMDASL
jgi:hypothetical protein